MLLQTAGDDGDFPPFEAGRDDSQSGSAPLPAVTIAIIHEAFVLRGRYGAEAEIEIDRRISLAMQDCRLDEVNHLWAVWLALKGNG